MNTIDDKIGQHRAQIRRLRERKRAADAKQFERWGRRLSALFDSPDLVEASLAKWETKRAEKQSVSVVSGGESSDSLLSESEPRPGVEDVDGSRYASRQFLGGV